MLSKYTVYQRDKMENDLSLVLYIENCIIRKFLYIVVW